MRTKQRSLRLAKTLGIAVSSVIGSLVLALIFEPFLGDTAHFLPFTLAVIISSWCGGLTLGLGATVASLLIVDYFFLVPVHHFFPIQSHELALLMLSLVVGVLISVLQSTLARANEALRKSREQVELAAEAGRIGFSESFSEDQVAWTPEMEKLFGLAPGTFEGTLSDWLKRIHPDDREAFRQERHRQTEQRQPELKFDYRAVLPNGEVRWLEGRRRLILSKAGEVERIVSASIDITDRHQLEQALTARTEELNHSNQELERFAYTVAHDLQSPLRNVEALTQLFFEAHAARARPGIDEPAGAGGGQRRSHAEADSTYARAGARSTRSEERRGRRYGHAGETGGRPDGGGGGGYRHFDRRSPHGPRR